LDTVTVTGAESVELLDVSRARATIVCVPLGTAVVSQLMLYGDVVSSLPSATLSMRNVTPPTAALSDALALIVTVPESGVAPVGAVMETVGPVVSCARVVAPAGADGLEVFAAASTACTV
jgi:hypothetical protein